MEVVEFEKRVKTGNGNKPMTDKQRRYIERLVINRKVDESYKNCVRKALDNGLNRLQASKIIDFLVSFIEFKKSFVVGEGSDVGMFGKSSMSNVDGMSDSIDKRDSELIGR
jgi:hypothetical protein